MTLNSIHSSQVEEATLMGTAAMTFFYSAITAGKVLLGSDTKNTRNANWELANKQTTFLGSAQKRMRYFIGSDSLTQRMSNAMKAAIAFMSTVVLVSTIDNSQQNQKLTAELDQFNAHTLAAKESAGTYIEECYTKNAQQSALAVIQCLGQVMPELATAKAEVEGLLQSCQQSASDHQKTQVDLQNAYKTIETQTNALTQSQKNSSECQAERSNLTKVNSAYEVVNNDLDNDKKRLAADLNTEKEKTAALEAQVQKLTEQNTNSASRLEEEQKANNELKSNVQESTTKYTEELALQKKEIKKLQDENNALNERLSGKVPMAKVD